MSCRHEFVFLAATTAAGDVDDPLIAVVSDDDLFQLRRAHGLSFIGDGERAPKRVEQLVHRLFVFAESV